LDAVYFSILAALVLGISKAGLKGLGVLIVTLMALSYPAKASTGILLPLLIFADIMAVLYYKKHAKWDLILRFLPWMILGILLGVIVGKDLPAKHFKQGMAIIIILSVIIMYAWERMKIKKMPTSLWFAGSMGTAAGFTTMIGNLAGAFSNIYFLALRIPKNEFIGTAAWLFFIVNLFKLPFHIWAWGTINTESFLISLKLIPWLIIGFITGIWIVKKIKNAQYRQFILIMTAIGAIVILFK
jgi:uncharacterized membrane protein YfcA